MPRPENVAAAPVRNPVPLTVMSWPVAPWPRLDGVALVAVGFAFTVKHAVHDPTPASPFVTVTLRGSSVAPPATSIFTVNSVPETNVVELTVIPVPENTAASGAPATNPDPPIEMF